MKKAKVNGTPIPDEAVQFEFDRLVKFYASHGMTPDEVKANVAKLQEKALEQAIGAKLLVDEAARLEIPVSAADVDAEVAKIAAQLGGMENYRKALAAQKIDEAAFRKELEKGARVNALVNKACLGVDEPTEDEVTAFFEAHREEYAAARQTIVESHDAIKDLLRHEARGRAMDAYVAELREKAKIEYEEAECGCGCGHHHHHHHNNNQH